MVQKGFQLLELIVVLAVLSLLLSFGVPPLFRITGDARLRLAAGELVGVLRLARSYAVRYDAHVAVKFRTESDGRITFTLFRDGDGDGVLSRDITTGVDSQVTVPAHLSQMGRGLGFGFPPGPPPPDPSAPGRPLDRRSDPIRFNQSDLASFGPLGTATPGSLYLTDHDRRLAAVRVLNRTGRVRVLLYDPDAAVWRD